MNYGLTVGTSDASNLFVFVICVDRLQHRCAVDHWWNIAFKQIPVIIGKGVSRPPRWRYRSDISVCAIWVKSHGNFKGIS